MGHSNKEQPGGEPEEGVTSIKNDELEVTTQQNSNHNEAILPIPMTLELEIDSSTDFSMVAQQVSEEAPTCFKIRKSSNSKEEPHWDCKSVQQFFQAVTSRTTLDSIYLENLGLECHAHQSFPVALATLLFTTPSRLRHFQLDCVCLRGTIDELQQLSHQIARQKCLKSFQMKFCGFATTLLQSSPSSAEISETTSLKIEPMIESLASLPSLQQLELWSYAENALGSLDDRNVGVLLQKSSQLQSLHLEGFVFDDQHIAALANSLHKDSHLTKLDLHLVKPTTVQACQNLAQIVLHNQTLQSVELFLSFPNKKDDENDNATSNTDNTVDNLQTMFLLELAQALQHNSSIHEIRLHTNQTIDTEETATIEQAFAHTLESNNHSLQWLHLNGVEGRERPNIDFHLHWNRRGRLLDNELQKTSCKLAAKLNYQAKLKQRKQKQYSKQHNNNDK